jgi:hypothetical protein
MRPIIHLLFGLIFLSSTQAQVLIVGGGASSTLKETSTVPSSGTFWSASGQLPPSPFDPLPQLPLYQYGPATDEVYIYDDCDYDDSQATAKGSISPDDSGPPGPPGAGGGDTNYIYVQPYNTMVFHPSTNCEEYSTNYWMLIALNPNNANQVMVGIGNCKPGTSYEILANDDLTTTNWLLLQTIVATNATNWTQWISVTSPTYFVARIVWPTLDWTNKLSCLISEWGHGMDSSPALSPDGNAV